MTTRDAPTPAPANGPVPSPVHSLTCLLVEDHTLIGQILASVLRGLAGIGDVTLATTVADAAAELDVDLLIVDLALPDGHGLDVSPPRWTSP